MTRIARTYACMTGPEWGMLAALFPFFATGQCDEAIPTLADWSHMKRTCAKGALAGLSELEWLTSEERKIPGSLKQATNLTWLHAPREHVAAECARCVAAAAKTPKVVKVRPAEPVVKVVTARPVVANDAQTAPDTSAATAEILALLVKVPTLGLIANDNDAAAIAAIVHEEGVPLDVALRALRKMSKWKTIAPRGGIMAQVRRWVTHEPPTEKPHMSPERGSMDEKRASRDLKRALAMDAPLLPKQTPAQTVSLTAATLATIGGARKVGDAWTVPVRRASYDTASAPAAAQIH